jgi:hypothetical protein
MMRMRMALRFFSTPMATERLSFTSSRRQPTTAHPPTAFRIPSHHRQLNISSLLSLHGATAVRTTDQLITSSSSRYPNPARPRETTQIPVQEPCKTSQKPTTGPEAQVLVNTIDQLIQEGRPDEITCLASTIHAPHPQVFDLHRLGTCGRVMSSRCIGLHAAVRSKARKTRPSEQTRVTGRIAARYMYRLQVAENVIRCS